MTVIARLLISPVRVPTGTIGLLRVSMPITPTSCTFIRPMSALSAAAAARSGTRFVA